MALNLNVFRDDLRYYICLLGEDEHECLIWDVPENTDPRFVEQIKALALLKCKQLVLNGESFEGHPSSPTIGMLSSDPPGGYITFNSGLALHAGLRSVCSRCFVWNSGQGIVTSQAWKKSNPDKALYCNDLMAAEYITNNWGIPRNELSAVAHSMYEIAVLDYMAKHNEPPDMPSFIPPLPQDFRISDEGLSRLREYRRVGYMNKIQADWIRVSELNNSIRLHQPVDPVLFPCNRAESEVLRIGAVTDTSFPVVCLKVGDATCEIFNRLRNRPEFYVDDRLVLNGQPRPFLHREMHQYYNNIDVFIVTARLEGGPLSPAEAACCGAPVLSTRCGHMEEMIQEGENGFLCDTIDDFMEKLELLARDRELLRYMSQRSQELVQNWHLESVIPQWLEFLC